MSKLVEKLVVEELTRMLDPHKKPYVMKKGKPNVVMFVGLQGSGKTTTCAKYAYHYSRKNFKTCMVCADTFRAGAFDQLKQNATKIRIPFYGSYTETDPVEIASQGVNIFKKEGFEVIIVDTSGRHKQADSLFKEMKEMTERICPDEIIFIMDSSIGQACYDQAMAFKKEVDVCSVIITKLDSKNKKGGGALSAVAATESPITFIGTGEHFDNFEAFNPASFIKRLLGLGDLEGIINIVKNVVSEDSQKELIEKMQRGIFTLKDLRTQYMTVIKMGPMNNIASMIPGMSNLMGGGGNDQENIKKMKRFICILDSMNEKELELKDKICDSRKMRIARGSGTSLIEVELLLENFKQIKKLVDKFSKMKLGSENMKDIMKNPNMLKNKLAGAMDPNMLRQMGGMENIMGMMKEFGNMEKNGQMGDLNKMLGGLMKKGKK